MLAALLVAAAPAAGAGERIGDRFAAAASPIDDVRGTAVHRRHSPAALARRALRWAWSELTGGAA